MKIKSKVNIITNSSSECFSIKGCGGTIEVASRWFKFLEDNYEDEYGTTENPDCCGVYDASIYLGEDKEVYIDYDIICNIDDAFEKITQCFGKENVKSK